LRPLDLRAPKTPRWAAWRPDGSAAILVGNGGSAILTDAERFQPLSTGTRHNLRGVAWAPDGKTALLVGNRGAALVLEGEAFTETTAVTGENLRRVAWHPAGEYALIAGNGGTVIRFDRRSGELAPLPGDRAHTLRAIAFRPDGAYALLGAYASRWAGYPRPHALYRCDGRFTQALLASDEEDDFVAIDWTADSLALAAGYAFGAGGTVHNKAVLYDGAAWRTRMWRDKGVILGAGWSPAGDWALLVGQSGLLARLDREGDARDLESGTEDNLIGPFWRPGRQTAIILKGPGDNVYTV